MPDRNTNSNYEMFRFYKGEKESPFDNDKQNAQHQFWFYESVFEDEFKRNSSADWHSFFSDHDMQLDFMNILSSSDHDRPSEDKKKPVFELWLTYLFTFKLYPEYGGENTYKKLYYSVER
ncbi:MAG: hypothetical protein LLF93_09380 [Bacteroidales bacterium]|nr:hypothetical protein [Bacteroidales bacterium]